MDRLFFFFITGALSALYWPALPPLFCLPLLLCLVLFCSHKIVLVPGNILAGLLLGICWMLSVGYWLKYTQPDNSVFDTRIVAYGEVLSVGTVHEEGRFNFRIMEYRTSGSSQGKRHCFDVRLRWRDPPLPLQLGQKLLIAVKLKPRWGLVNEAGFDYQKWLFAENIVATGYVVESSENQLLTTSSHFRQQLASEFVSMHIPELRWFLALAIGYRGALTPTDWDLLRKTGTAHLVAISGMHLGMVALWSYSIFVVVLAILRTVVRRNIITNIRAQALTLSILPCVLYAALAGFSIPTLRAFMMLVFGVSLIKFGINWGGRRFILVSLAAFIVCFPLSIFTMSFWLSFTALLIIGFLLWRFPIGNEAKRPVYKLWYFVRMQLFMTLLMLPLVLFFFGGASLVSPLANIIAVPFVTFLLLPLSLTVVALQLIDSDLMFSVLNLTLLLFAEFERLLQVFAQQPSSWLAFGTIEYRAGVAATVALVLMLLPRFIIPKSFYWALFIPLISGFDENESDTWQIDLLDVGQGLSVLIRKNAHAIVYDTGAAYPSGFNMADTVLLPVLNGANVHYLDKLIISHEDNDHAGGFDVLTRQIPIADIRRSPATCHADLDFTWQGLSFDVLWPDFNYPQLLNSDNNMSCVIRISDGKNSVLLAGDIEYSVERVLVHLAREKQVNLSSSILIAPHHGSRTSSTSSFISTVSPQYSLVSAGFRNRWNMPAEEVQRRYQKAGIPLLNTADHGQIRVRFSQSRWPEVSGWRLNERSRWYSQHF